MKTFTDDGLEYMLMLRATEMVLENVLHNALHQRLEIVTAVSIQPFSVI